MITRMGDDEAYFKAANGVEILALIDNDEYQFGTNFTIDDRENILEELCRCRRKIEAFEQLISLLPSAKVEILYEDGDYQASAFVTKDLVEETFNVTE